MRLEINNKYVKQLFNVVNKLFLLGFLLTRCHDKYTSEIGYNLWSEKHNDKFFNKVPVETALPVYTV